MGMSGFGSGSVGLDHRGGDCEVLHPTRQVGQPSGDPVAALGFAADTPVLPAADRGRDRSLGVDVAARHVADHIIGEVAAHAAVEEIADADHLVLAVGADGSSDQARGKRPDFRAAAVALRANSQGPEEPVVLVAAGQNGVRGYGGGSLAFGQAVQGGIGHWAAPSGAWASGSSSIHPPSRQT